LFDRWLADGAKLKKPRSRQIFSISKLREARHTLSKDFNLWKTKREGKNKERQHQIEDDVGVKEKDDNIEHDNYFEL